MRNLHPQVPGAIDFDLYPSIELAYHDARASYDITLRRLDAIDKRLDTLQATAATISFAVPVLIKTLQTNATLKSPWLLIALSLFALVEFAATVVRAWGGVTVVDPRALYTKTLHLPPRVYHLRAVYWAGQHFEKNRKVINLKGAAANGLTAAVVIEFALLLVWAIREIEI